MSRCSRAVMLAGLSVLWCGVSASAETLRCRSVNGNVNCAGSGSVSCQTINGKTVCVGDRGAVMQSFGNSQGQPADMLDDPMDAAGDPDWDGRD
jgi:hypothetical protein